MSLSDFILPCLPILMTKGNHVPTPEEKHKWIYQLLGSIVVQLVVASIIALVMMYGVTERLTVRMEKVEKALENVQAELRSK